MEQALNKKAIVLGFLVDIVGSTVAGFLLGFAIGFSASSSGADPMMVMNSAGFGILSFIIGLAFTVLGGFYAATRAGFRHLAHAAWTGGTITIVFGLTSLGFKLYGLMVDPGSVEPKKLLITVIAVAITVPAAMFGGYLGMLYQKKAGSN